MTQHNDHSPAKRSLRGWLLAALLAATAGTAGIAGAVVANAPAIRAMHGAQVAADPAAMDQHFAETLARILPDATPEQKARLTEIARSVHAEMRATHAQLGQTHKRLFELLEQPKVDRAAIEALRATQVRQIDAASARFVRALADAAEVLSPAQRVQLLEQMKAHMHAGGMHAS